MTIETLPDNHDSSLKKIREPRTDTEDALVKDRRC